MEFLAHGYYSFHYSSLRAEDARFRAGARVGSQEFSLRLFAFQVGYRTLAFFSPLRPEPVLDGVVGWMPVPLLAKFQH
jgi:hypothetical protein